jgi:hypothetical protein
MITEIGIVAGEIWHDLDAHGDALLSGMVKNLDRSRDLVLMSLGWLAREGHVILVSTDKDFRISLRK